MSGQESLFGLDVFGSIFPTAGFILHGRSCQTLQTRISTWRKELSRKAGYRFDAALKGSHHQSGEIVMEECKVRRRRSGKPSPN